MNHFEHVTKSVLANICRGTSFRTPFVIKVRTINMILSSAEKYSSLLQAASMAGNFSAMNRVYRGKTSEGLNAASFKETLVLILTTEGRARMDRGTSHSKGPGFKFLVRRLVVLNPPRNGLDSASNQVSSASYCPSYSLSTNHFTILPV
jgi:hypothetical protein